MEPIGHWITETVNNLVVHGGYPGIFALLILGIVGLPVPDETILTYVGYLAYKGELSLIPALLTVFLGSACGITLSYALGKWLGLKLLHKYGRYVRITPEHLEKTHQWFERVGKWILTIGYFIPGVRHLTAYVAGATELKRSEFALFAYSGALVWSMGFVMLGYLLGERWHKVGEMIHAHLTVALLIGAGLLGVYLLVKYMKRRSAIAGGTESEQQ